MLKVLCREFISFKDTLNFYITAISLMVVLLLYVTYKTQVQLENLQLEIKTLKAAIELQKLELLAIEPETPSAEWFRNLESKHLLGVALIIVSGLLGFGLSQTFGHPVNINFDDSLATKDLVEQVYENLATGNTRKMFSILEEINISNKILSKDIKISTATIKGFFETALSVIKRSGGIDRGY